MYEKLTVMDMATQQMDWLAKRTELVAQNIANIDTPAYTPQDLKPLDFKGMISETQQPAVVAVADNPRHIVPQASPAPVVTQSRVYESSPDGNAVVMEDQMNKLGDARDSYQTAAALYQKQVALLKLAIMGHE